MPTPTYKGQGQPTATSGGWLSDWFGSSTPAYKPAPTVPSTSTPSSPSPTSATSNASAKQRRAFFVMPDGREIEVVIPRGSGDDACADDTASDPTE